MANFCPNVETVGMQNLHDLSRLVLIGINVGLLLLCTGHFVCLLLEITGGGF